MPQTYNKFSKGDIPMISVAIDGPAGAGKSSLSRAAAKELGFLYVDTGALYRTIALGFLQSNTDIDDLKAVEKLLSEIEVDLMFNEQGEQRVLLNGVDVSDSIRTPEVSMKASAVSALASVRAFLLDKQRSLAESNNVLMDGRDIGTVVLPNATIKIFLTASPEDRARRRFEELKARGSSVTFEEVYEDMLKRDYDDSHRKIAPLKPADDAVIVDTTGFEIEKSLAAILKTVRERL